MGELKLRHIVNAPAPAAIAATTKHAKAMRIGLLTRRGSNPGADTSSDGTGGEDLTVQAPNGAHAEQRVRHEHLVGAAQGFDVHVDLFVRQVEGGAGLEHQTAHDTADAAALDPRRANPGTIHREHVVARAADDEIAGAQQHAFVDTAVPQFYLRHDLFQAA
jgi:hypothetical protein